MQNGHEEMQCDLPFTCQCCRMERQTPIAEPTVYEIERVLDSATQLYIAWHYSAFSRSQLTRLYASFPGSKIGLGKKR